MEKEGSSYHLCLLEDRLLRVKEGSNCLPWTSNQSCLVEEESLPWTLNRPSTEEEGSNYRLYLLEDRLFRVKEESSSPEMVKRDRTELFWLVEEDSYCLEKDSRRDFL